MTGGPFTEVKLRDLKQYRLSICRACGVLIVGNTAAHLQQHAQEKK